MNYAGNCATESSALQWPEDNKYDVYYPTHKPGVICTEIDQRNEVLLSRKLANNTDKTDY